MAPTTSRVEVSGIVEADREELFYYTDWCYNAPEWFPSIRKTWIIKLPDSAGLGLVTRYVGDLMGREMEWVAESVEWKKNELRKMKAISGLPAKMSMQLQLRFEAAGPGKTKVTCVLEYRAPFPLVGRLVDRFYLRPGAQRFASDAIEGMKAAADHHKVSPVDLQFERRKIDHPGYAIAFESRRTQTLKAKSTV